MLAHESRLAGSQRTGLSGMKTRNILLVTTDGLAAGTADNRVWLWNLTDSAHPVQFGQPLTVGPFGDE